MATYTIRTETVGSITYVGEAAIGSSEASPVWRIKRITDTGSGIKIEFVDGNSEWDSSWTDRVSYTYS